MNWKTFQSQKTSKSMKYQHFIHRSQRNKKPIQMILIENDHCKFYACPFSRTHDESFVCSTTFKNRTFDFFPQQKTGNVREHMEKKHNGCMFQHNQLVQIPTSLLLRPHLVKTKPEKQMTHGISDEDILCVTDNRKQNIDQEKLSKVNSCIINVMYELNEYEKPFADLMLKKQFQEEELKLNTRAEIEKDIIEKNNMSDKDFYQLQQKLFSQSQSLNHNRLNKKKRKIINVQPTNNKKSLRIVSV